MVAHAPPVSTASKPASRSARPTAAATSRSDERRVNFTGVSGRLAGGAWAPPQLGDAILQNRVSAGKREQVPLQLLAREVARVQADQPHAAHGPAGDQAVAFEAPDGHLHAAYWQLEHARQF